ncbi:MAG: EpsG family protein [Propionibacteriales bacterium]|nr:EpsG family protein [Propionibacteriales bacterium]
MLPYYVAILLSVAFAHQGRRAAAPVRVTAVEGEATRAQGPPISAPGILLLASASVLTFMAALRWRVGTDFGNYENLYPLYVATPRAEMGIFDEPGIRVIAKIAHATRDDPATMFAIAAVITVGLTIWTIFRSTDRPALAIYLYIACASWQGSFNGIRQYLACAVLFAGHQLILQRRFRPYVLVVFLAMLFHVSAIVMLLLYWVPRRPLRPAGTLLLVGVAFLALNSYEVFGQLVDAIKDDDTSAAAYFVEQINPLRIAIAFAPCVVFLLFAKKDELTERASFYSNIMLIHAVVLVASLNSAYVARFSIYTLVYVAVALPAILGATGRNRSLLTLLAVGGFAAFWYLETTSQPALIPFQWVMSRSG